MAPIPFSLSPSLNTRHCLLPPPHHAFSDFVDDFFFFQPQISWCRLPCLLLFIISSLSFYKHRWFACQFSPIVWRQSPTLKSAERGRSLSVLPPRLLSSFCNVCSNMVSHISTLLLCWYTWKERNKFSCNLVCAGSKLKGSVFCTTWCVHIMISSGQENAPSSVSLPSHARVWQTGERIHRFFSPVHK